MKTNRFWLLLVTVLAAAILICWLFRQPPAAEKTVSGGVSETEQIKLEVVQTANGITSIATPSKIQLATSSQGQNSTTEQQTIKQSQQPTAEQQGQAWIDSENKEINFYGKIVDQTNNPIGGVKVTMHVRQWNMSATNAQDISGKIIPIERETGVDGCFEIN